MRHCARYVEGFFMLKYRLLTGFILIPLVVLAILFLPHSLFMLVSGILMLIATWEWTTLLQWRHINVRVLALFIMAALIFCSGWLPIALLLIGSTLWWLFNLACIIAYNQQKLPDFFKHRGWLIFAGLMSIIPCWIAMNQVRIMFLGNLWLLVMLAMIWAADTGAYFSGRWFGKTKLATQVSPNKTWEGFWGGLLATLVVTIFIAAILHMQTSTWPQLALFALLAFGFSVIGDLYMSLLKRQQKLKDTGNLLPGHGGLLDRIDSLLAVMPVFSLALLAFGWIR